MIARERPDALVKTVTVSVDVKAAFALFTEQMSAWWPLATHSVGEAAATAVTVEGRIGGEIVETYGDGLLAVWGTVTEWDPPSLVSFTWHPGSPSSEATHVAVRFTDVGDGTEVRLVHSGWTSRPDGAGARRGYDSGWEFVLGRLTEAATPRAS